MKQKKIQTEKRCYKCDRILPVNCFDKNRSRSTGLSSECKECKKNYKKQSSYKYKLTKEGMKNKREKRREWYKSIKIGNTCCLCKEDTPCCLDYHHLDNATKEQNIAMMVCRYGKSRILSEIKKCVVLCSNCHRKVHAGILKIKDPLTDLSTTASGQCLD